MHQALWSCRGLSNRRRKTIDLGLFRSLLDLERRMDVPEQLRGMTLAKACIESGYTPDVKGDCGYGTCKAVGIIQLWPWTQRFGVDRTDPIESVQFLLTRVHVGLEKLHRRCPCIKGELNRFVMAWLRINRGPIKGTRQRCAGTPHGLRRLRQWHRNIIKLRASRAKSERRAHRRAMRRAARKAARRSARNRSRPTKQGDWGYNASSAIWSTRPVRRIYIW
ncbi:MAG: hypothetical protein KC502_06840 [Myxococcales bacterium]|nr:hypothetical protein [Myxococcales bacterium]